MCVLVVLVMRASAVVVLSHKLTPGSDLVYVQVLLLVVVARLVCSKLVLLLL